MDSSSFVRLPNKLSLILELKVFSSLRKKFSESRKEFNHPFLPKLAGETPLPIFSQFLF
jgi:hypothetical protein